MGPGSARWTRTCRDREDGRGCRPSRGSFRDGPAACAAVEWRPTLYHDSRRIGMSLRRGPGSSVVAQGTQGVAQRPRIVADLGSAIAISPWRTRAGRGRGPAAARCSHSCGGSPSHSRAANRTCAARCSWSRPGMLELQQPRAGRPGRARGQRGRGRSVGVPPAGTGSANARPGERLQVAVGQQPLDQRAVQAERRRIAVGLGELPGGVPDLVEGRPYALLGQAGPRARPADPGREHVRHRLLLGRAEHHLARQPVQQERLALDRADPQRPAEVVRRSRSR